jgi:hypothetical protein
MATEIAPGIFTVDTSTVQGNIGFIVGRRVALAVDAGIDDVEGRRIADAVRAIGPRQTIIIRTAPRPCLGGSAFQADGLHIGRAASCSPSPRAHRCRVRGSGADNLGT